MAFETNGTTTDVEVFVVSRYLDTTIHGNNSTAFVLTTVLSILNRVVTIYAGVRENVCQVNFWRCHPKIHP